MNPRHFSCLLMSFLFLTALPGYAQDGDTAWAYTYYQKATQLTGSLQYDSAIVYYKEASKQYQAASSWQSYIKAQNQIGVNYYFLSRFDDAIASLEKTLELGIENLGASHPEVAVSYHTTGICYAGLGMYQQALLHIKKGLDIRLENYGENHAATAESYADIGWCTGAMGNYKEQLPYYEKALAIRINVLGEEHNDVAGTYNNIAEYYSEQGDYDQQLSYLKKALHIWGKTLGDMHPYVGLAYDNLGTAYGNKGDYHQAFQHYQKGLFIRLETLGGNHLHVATSYNNIAWCHLTKGNYRKGLESLKKALGIQLASLGEGNLNLVTTYNNLGSCYSSLGDNDKALLYYHRILNIGEKHLGADHPYLALTHTNISVCYGEKGLYDKQLAALQRALDIRLKNLGENHPKTAQTYFNLGFCYENKGDISKGLFYYHKALDIRINTIGDTHPDVIDTYNNIGMSYDDHGNHKEALVFLEKALEVLEYLPEKDAHRSLIYRNLGNTYMKINDEKKGLYYLQQSLIEGTIGFTDTSIYANPSLKDHEMISRRDLLHALELKGTALRNHYLEKSHNIKDLQYALKTLLLAIDLADTIRLAHHNQNTIKELTEKTFSIYRYAVKAAFNLFEYSKEETYLNQAFNIAEKSKAFLLDRALQESQARQFGQVPDSLLEKEQDLKVDLAFYKKRAFEAENNNDSVKLRLYRDYLFKRRGEYDRLIARLEKEYPLYHQLKYSRKPTTIAAIQQQLDEKSLFLEYFTTEGAVYLFRISKYDAQLHAVLKPENFDAQVMTLQKALSHFSEEDALQRYQQYTDAAWQLYELLLAPALANDSTSRLFIVPDALLTYIPFEALIDERPAKADPDYGHLAYLIRKQAISYAYSASLWLKQQREMKASRRLRCLAFAPAYQDAGAAHPARGALAALRNANHALPGAQQEIQNLSRYFKGNYYFGEAATERHFKQAAETYNIIHLAMHGQIHDEEPLYSKLLFSAVNDSVEDQALHTYELYNMNIHADLVVLSACETGFGPLVKGEGLMSLARAFMYAGSPSVVMSLWKIEDQATSALMSAFYGYLSKGARKDESLQKAKLNYLKSADKLSSHPFFWAGFVCVGNSEAIVSGAQFSPWLLVIPLLLILVLWFFLRRKTRKTTAMP